MLITVRTLDLVQGSKHTACSAGSNILTRQQVQGAQSGLNYLSVAVISGKTLQSIKSVKVKKYEKFKVSKRQSVNVSNCKSVKMLKCQSENSVKL